MGLGMFGILKAPWLNGVGCTKMASQQAAVLEAFKKFDKDQNGSISKEELAEVLKTLDPEDWDDNAIDRLMASADANGDGALQIDEFLRWIFAEDVEQLGTELGNSSLTILIDGCSRADLNGEYVQQDEFYGHRPVFFNSAEGKYLFYNRKHQRWQIFVRTSWKASARLPTQPCSPLVRGSMACLCWRNLRQGASDVHVLGTTLDCRGEVRQGTRSHLCENEVGATPPEAM